MLDVLWEQLLSINWLGIVQAIIILAVGLTLARLVARSVARAVVKHLGVHQSTLLQRVIFYFLTALIVASALHQMGFRLGVLLGAAGILSVAIGFASQTSASNLISGLFLLAERPFQLGDVIRVGDTTGEVLAVDLLSVKLRTFDNLFVRIPNETLVRSQVTNFARFPIRRYDLQLGVAYKEDLARVRKILLDVADRNPLCLDEPKPLVIFQAFGNSSVDLQLSAWTRRENFLELRNTIPDEIKLAFEREGVEIPFPHLSLYTGSATTPFPVQSVPQPAPEAGEPQAGPRESRPEGDASGAGDQR